MQTVRVGFIYAVSYKELIPQRLVTWHGWAVRTVPVLQLRIWGEESKWHQGQLMATHHSAEGQQWPRLAGGSKDP